MRIQMLVSLGYRGIGGPPYLLMQEDARWKVIFNRNKSNYFSSTPVVSGDFVKLGDYWPVFSDALFFLLKHFIRSCPCILSCQVTVI